MAVEVTVGGALPELFSEYVEYKRNLGYVYPKSRIYLVRLLSRFLAGRAALPVVGCLPVHERPRSKERSCFSYQSNTTTRV